MNSRVSSAILKYRQIQMKNAKKSTVKTVEGLINNYLHPDFGCKTVGMITKDLVNEYVNGDKVSHLKQKSLRNLVGLLSTITGVRFPKRSISYPGGNEIPEDEPCFTPEEMQSIVEAATGLYKVLFATFMETGARPGEVYGLEVTDIDWSRSQIHIIRSAYDGVIQTPKTKNARRVIDVKPWLLDLIKQYLGGRKTGIVFTNTRGNILRHSTVLRRHLHPLLKELGIPKCGAKAFRHGRVSYLVEQGVSDKVIMEWIGHGSAAMIRKYLHLRTSYRAAVLANVASLQPNHPTSLPSTSGEQVAAGA